MDTLPYTYEAYEGDDGSLHLFALDYSGLVVWGDRYGEGYTDDMGHAPETCAAHDWYALMSGQSDPVRDGWATLGGYPSSNDEKGAQAGYAELADVKNDHLSFRNQTPIASSRWTGYHDLGIIMEYCTSHISSQFRRDAVNLSRCTPDDLYIDHWRVHLVLPGEHYGPGDALTYEQQDAETLGSGLPLVEFYDTKRDWVMFPQGEFVRRYFMDTLLGTDQRSAILDGGQPSDVLRLDAAPGAAERRFGRTVRHPDALTISGTYLADIGNWLERRAGELTGAREAPEPERQPSLREEAKESRASSEALEAAQPHDRGRDIPVIRASVPDF